MISLSVLYFCKSTNISVGFSQHQDEAPLIYFPSVVLHTEETEVSSEYSWGFEAVLPSARQAASSLLKHGFCYSQNLQENVFRPLHLSSLLYYVVCGLMCLRDMRRIRLVALILCYFCFYNNSIRLLLSLPHAWKGYTEDVCHVVLGELNLGALALLPAHILPLYHDSTSLTGKFTFLTNYSGLNAFLQLWLLGWAEEWRLSQSWKELYLRRRHRGTQRWAAI